MRSSVQRKTESSGNNSSKTPQTLAVETDKDAAISAQGASLEMADILLNMDLRQVVKKPFTDPQNMNNFVD